MENRIKQIKPTIAPELNQITLVPMTQSIHQLFEQQVQRTPEAMALIGENRQISYESLNQKANQLAHYLQKCGLKSESLVGLSVERSPEMVMALLAILKAGCAYVPLDPDYPPERLNYMIQDAQLSLIITNSYLIGKFGDNQRVKILKLDEDWELIAREKPENPDIEVNHENLAYIIYTSGSTGKPKGVMIEHRSVVNFIEVVKTTANLSQSDRILQFASISFDVAVEEIYPCLTVGGTVVLRTEAMLNSFSSFIQKCREWQLTILDLPTAFWQALITELARTKEPFPESVRLLLVGGESLLPEKLKLWQQYIEEMLQTGKLRRVPQLINAYGPTETTVEATYCDLSNYKLTENCTSVPIGRPINQTQIYILDQNLQPVPQGTQGELYIGGISLARGYLNQLELTQENFINNPFNPSERLYKTGDLGRYLADGDIEYLGRIDNQIKIRGFRVELGEIENVLIQHSAIDSAAVILSQDQLGDKQLIAYVVPHLTSEDPLEQEKTQQEYLALWKTVNQQTDSQTPIQSDLTFNIIGWDSSYDGQPIPEEEMHEWVDKTVERIQELHPEKVLEIGCGTGLLLTRVAPDCSEYVGLDFSRPALDHIRKIQQTIGGLDHVTLWERSADDLAGLESESFDTIIMNSVLQHFPSTAYLLQVLEGLIKLVKKGGHILVGDIRNLALLPTYCTSVEAYRANDNVLACQLQERITRKHQAEEELLLHPFFFLALQQQFTEITHVQIKPKTGVYDNELTRFRYEAILSINSSVEPLTEIDWLDWQKEQLNLAEVKRILTEDQPKNLGISRIPNARLSKEVKVQQWLEEADQSDSLKQLNQWLGKQPKHGVEIDRIMALVEDLPYHLEISWINTDATGYYDLVFSHKSAPFQPAIFSISSPIEDIFTYANNPIEIKFKQQLVLELSQFIKSQLPEYMLPNAISILDKLPLTPNDKIDRLALSKLAKPSYLLTSNKANFVAPRNREEEILANLWSEVLQLEPIGINDNFFELGGNSLKVIILLNRIQEKLNKNLQMLDLFQSPTIAEIVTCLSKKSSTFNRIEATNSQSADEIRYYPPSFAQERFWDYRHLGSFYYLPNYFHLEGKLNVAILEKSFNEIIRRHEILRTKLEEINGSLRQVVYPNTKIALEIIDLQNRSEVEQQQEIERITAEKIKNQVFLDKDPWLFVNLLQLSETSHILLIGLHIMLANEQSSEILMAELSLLYDTFLSDNPSPLDELPLQYGDYAIAERQSLTEEGLKIRRDYWQQWLSREPQPLNLPTDRSLPEVQSFQAATLKTQISPELTTQLEILSQKQKVTFFTTIATAFGLLLHQYDSQESLVICVPAIDSNQQQFASVMGDFGKHLLLRLNFGENDHFFHLLKRVQQEMLAVITHQDVPFEQIAKTFDPPIERNKRFFRVYLDFLQKAPTDHLELSGLNVTPIPIKSSMARVDLGILFWKKNTPSGTVIQLWWKYKKELFQADTITRIASNFENLLEVIVNQ
ncbi:MAG: non-ribosomal peptide synthetase [Microcystis flos-aquae Mf_WU_F_19750830_S460]|uniref:Non-ribosomal peptide synthetase n=2 Tax=Microcystis TaxID=1125 RepID=A0A552M065_9CHRO|nr:MAG: non-ribosomal peptide synthetase [Microcystis flos-aquae Mf_WU_F_19750830_S460]